MTQADYEYRGLIATCWDLLRGDTSRWPDRAFYREVILQSGQPALDVGCGTGRLVLDYRAEGLDVDGVDNSPEMLAICRDKARKRRLTVSLQLVTDKAAAAETMKCFFGHLEPGGTLVMPFMVIYTGAAAVGESFVAEDWKLVAERVRPEDGATVRRRSRSTYDVPNQLEHTEDLYEVIHGDRVVASEHHSRSPATRWYTQAQAVQLYEAAGFARIRVLHKFTFEPASPEDTLFSVLGTRP
jgi:SAM-dependent methyltransferase